MAQSATVRSVYGAFRNQLNRISAAYGGISSAALDDLISDAADSDATLEEIWDDILETLENDDLREWYEDRNHEIGQDDFITKTNDDAWYKDGWENIEYINGQWIDTSTGEIFWNGDE